MNSIEKNSGAPMIAVWFGNFFEPFCSQYDVTGKGIAEVADLGFNSINLDSKPWEDFFERYRGGPASTYVAMQEFMMKEAEKNGMDYTCLALYLCGDNLYPSIRDIPPVRGEEAVLPDGSPMGTYNYRSPKAHASMVEHVKGLLRLYGAGMRRKPDGRIIMQTMFDPIPKPSFHDEGVTHYLQWLEKRYKGNIQVLNDRYHLSASAFRDLRPDEYWLHPEKLNWVDCARPATADFEHRTPVFYRWIDNQTYLAGIMEDYFKTMKEYWHQQDMNLFIEPVLHQWGYFFNPPEQAMWQTALRALDIYKLSTYIDGTLFIAAPINAENRADAMALSVEGSILRNANGGRPFTAGLYLGRHVNGDIYRMVSPAESIATLIAGGAKNFHMYGYSGLDDGGVLFRMDSVFKESLKTGNRWAAEVIPLLDQPRAKEIAILFPAEMSLYEPLETDPNGRHRMDLLGWYTQFTDLGWHVDILHPDQIAKEGLAGYQHLVVPHNSLYDLSDNTALEAAVKKFVETGGTLFHGPHCGLAQALGIEEITVAFDCFEWREDVIPHGWSTVAFTGGEPLATYIQSGKTAIAKTILGKGAVYSFGFQYGHAYSRKSMPIVPPLYGKREMHPIVLLEETPLAAIVSAASGLSIAPIKGVEFARFGNRMVIVNHRSSPIDISGLNIKSEVTQFSFQDGMVAAHSATCLEL